MKPDMKIKLTPFIIAGVFSILAFSCSNDDPPTTEYDYDKHYIDNQPKDDKVETLFHGKVVCLQPNNNNVISYLTKRFSNSSVELTTDADVVVLDNSRTLSIQDKEFEILKRLWDHNKIIVFINPDAGTYNLVNKLKSQDYNGNPSTEDLKIFDDIQIYATRADGTSFFHEKMDTQSGPDEVSILKITETGTTEEAVTPEPPYIAQPNDYHIGRIAENLAKWLLEYAVIGDTRHVAFTRADSYGVKPMDVTYHQTITITHDWVQEHCEDATIPSSTTVDAKSQISIYGLYDTDKRCDIYDINMYEDFPANQTFVDDVYVYEHLAYNYKYTGGCYLGPETKLSLVDIPESTIEIEEPAPLPLTNGQYNTTHYPAQFSFGANGGVDISTEPGLSLGLSMGCTLPTTTISFNKQEMPISFSNANKQAEWKYNVDLKIYTIRAGFNAVVNDYPEIVHEYCKTDQAVTFFVSNSQSFGKKDLFLKWDLTRRVQSEYAGIWEGWWNIKSFNSNRTIQLPKVYRYFEKYSPYPLPGYGGTADSADWSNLEALLMQSVNYRALCDETLKVGAQVESELDKTAESIWRAALEPLVAQFNGTTTSHDYVIALARADGTHIGLGLHIQKDGTWKVVENVDNIKAN